MIPKALRHSSLALALCATTGCAVSVSKPYRLDVAPSMTPRAAGFSVRLQADSVVAPRGDQIIAGWMGSVLGGFIAWRIFDDPDGRHSKVQDGWRYTPRALTALAIGSHIGTTAGVWARGRAIGSRGSLLFTSIGAALPTVPILANRDDPLLMLKVVAAWAPLQGYLGYTGYRFGTRKSARPVPDAVVANRDDSRPRRSTQVIGREELKGTAYTNALDAVLQLRPHWVSAARQRGTIDRDAGGVAAAIVVYLDGTRLGGMDALRQMELGGVEAIEYFDGREATNLFGTGHSAGAINVRRSLGAP
jgi:hypothetical protein